MANIPNRPENHQCILWHEKNNAVFVDAGVWLRPRYYKQGSEDLFEASKREAENVRKNVGVCDVTTLGKIDIKGPDAAEFLNRIYTNAWLKLTSWKSKIWGNVKRRWNCNG